MTGQILVPLTGAKRDEIALSAAFAAAARLDGNVNALFVHEDPREVFASSFGRYGGAPLAVSYEIAESMLGTQTKMAHEAEDSARAMLIAAAGKSGAKVDRKSVV